MYQWNGMIRWFASSRGSLIYQIMMWYQTSKSQKWWSSFLCLCVWLHDHPYRYCPSCQAIRSSVRLSSHPEFNKRENMNNKVANNPKFTHRQHYTKYTTYHLPSILNDTTFNLFWKDLVLQIMDITKFLFCFCFTASRRVWQPYILSFYLASLYDFCWIIL